MKKKITRLFSALFFMCALLMGFHAQSQTTQDTSKSSTSTASASTTSTTTTAASTDAVKKTDATADTSFHPVRRLWGYAFGDLYYKQHSDPLNRGGSNQYTGIAQNRNSFQFRRIYLGYDYDITKKFSAEVLLAAEDNSENPAIIGGAPSTGNGDVLADNKLAFYIKLANLRVKNIWKGTDLVIGQQSTPAFPLLSEKIWAYRSIERTVADIRRTPSFDLGVGLQGTIDHDKNYGYNLLVANGQGAKAANNTFKWFSGDIFAKFLDKKLVLDLYADYEKLTSNTYVTTTTTVPGPPPVTTTTTAFFPSQSRSMIKGYVAYTTNNITVGVEAFTNKIKNGALGTNVAAKTSGYVDLSSVALSAYVRGTITKDKLGFFVRYDTYNPDNKFDQNLTYSKDAVSQYDPNNKEIFITGGLDYTPFKNVHFMPNVWFNQYTSQYSNLTGSAHQNHDMVFRATFYYTFGK